MFGKKALTNQVSNNVLDVSGLRKGLYVIDIKLVDGKTSKQNL